MILDRTSLLAAIRASTPKMESVDVPEWGGAVFVRVMSGTERDAFEEIHSKQLYRGFRARLAVATVCDDKGDLVFTPSDLAEVGDVDVVTLDRITEVATRLNGLRKAEAQALDSGSLGPD